MSQSQVIGGIVSGLSRRYRLRERDKRIMRQRSAGLSYREIGELHGVSDTCIRYAVKRMGGDPSPWPKGKHRTRIYYDRGLGNERRETA